jgi:protein-S-isoprenylcysteine O-methyltransferase Ste14
MPALVYAFHGLFWAAFLARALRRGVPAAGASAPAAPAPSRASPGARLVFLLHGLGFAVLYAGIGEVVFGRPGAPRFFALHWGAGALVIVAGAALFASSLYVFDSWRLLAAVETGHRLCTRGPYGLVRHPIYVACDLLALGTFLWLPTVMIGVGTVLMLIGGDLRARAEERVLRAAFGEEYRRYEERVKRYVPGVY